MSSLSVLLLCSDGFRVRRFSRILAASGFARLQVVSDDGGCAQFPPTLGELDLVICDSLQSLSAIHYLRLLCEHYGFFSMMECEALAAPIRWGLANFRVHSGKYRVGSYNELDTLQISGLLLNALTVKRTVQSPACSDTPLASQGACASNDRGAGLDVVQALEQRQIVPCFQPQVCMKTRRITGAEVLVRWLHPQRGVLGPQIFLDLFDSPQLHRQLLDGLLQQGLALQRQLQARTNAEVLAFSYNIEAEQLSDPQFATRVLQQIDAADVPKQQVTLEITERQALVLGMQSIENISVLVKSGVRLSLDDFGTGHSSIMRLADIPFGQIKLDSGFVANALELKETRIIEAIVGMARSLNLQLVAEGIETEQQLAHLQRLGVEAAQGFLFHKPMTAAALLQVLALSHPPQLQIGQG